LTIENVLAERGKRYGDFSDHAKIAQELQDVIRATPSWNKMNSVMKQSLTVIADKIARICSGDPNYEDNWIDIQGYAKLVEDRLGQTKPSVTINVIPSANEEAQKAIQRALRDSVTSWRDSEKRLNSTPVYVPQGGSLTVKSSDAQIYNVGGTIANLKPHAVGEQPSEQFRHPGVTADFKG